MFARLIVTALIVVSSGAASAQQPLKRLSDWLLEHDRVDNAYPLGLSWRVPGEVPAQHAIWLALLADIEDKAGDVRATAAARARLASWLRTRQATGRVPVAQADARWLQANPARDPVLRPGHVVVLPTRPRSVTVINGEGELCAIEHAAGREAIHYVQACGVGSGAVDWAWIAQPDGRTQRAGAAFWNRSEQDEPAPGSWIWAPARDSGWPERFSERLVAFLATQGPAPDPDSDKAGMLKPAASDRSFFSGTPSRDLPLTASDWGGIGLLQTPTARMRPVGGFGFHIARTFPYTQGNITLQPFEWMEAGFRYTNISGVAYGPPELSGDQSYKDKSFDLKLRLLPESWLFPEFAVGARDITGTGLFAGEYFVASKRLGDFDFSLGMGWGYVGGRGNIRNPLSRLSGKFDSRIVNVGQGGEFSFGQYFRGTTSLFGGVQWQSPWKSLVFKAEYDGNSYQREPFGNNQPQKSPWNFGMVYRPGRAFDLTLGFERGNTLTLGITLHSQLNDISVPKISDPPRVPVAATRPQSARPDWAATSREIRRQTEWHVGAIEQQGRDLNVTITDPEAFYWRDRVDRLASVLHRDAPASVDRFRLRYQQRGLAVAEHTVDRDAWVAERTEPLPEREKRESVISAAVGHSPARLADAVPAGERYENTLPRFEAGLGAVYQQTLGGPDGFVLYQFGLAERVKFRIRPDTWLQGTFQLGLIDNYDKFKYTAPSNLPRVRTYLREYVTSTSFTIPNLQATHVGRLGDNQFYSVYGGLLEYSFAGVGAEWLYRPNGSRVAFGVDVNQVRQREFEQRFGMRDYSVFTGHGTLYWDTGWNQVQANLSVGQYLARDRGVTVDVSRLFNNGVRMGAFFSRTNVSKEQFGEGSFDKGVYVTIPFDAFLTRSSTSVANFVWKPLTRDGGAKLGRAVALYDLAQTRDDRTLRWTPAPAPNHTAPPADHRAAWTGTPAGPAPQTQLTPRARADAWQADGRFEQDLIAALHRQDFRNIRVSFDPTYRLTVELSNEELRPVSRAVGRAARTALRLAPLDAREIRIVFFERAAPAVRYDFVDLDRLERFFAGVVPLEALAPTVAVEQLNPSAREARPLAELGDLDTRVDDKNLARLLPDVRPVTRVARDVAQTAQDATGADWLRLGALGAGLVLGSSLLDKRADRLAQDHASDGWRKSGSRFGNALPVFAMAGAGLAALDSDPVRSRTGYAALEAGGAAFLASTGLKYAFGRARPATGLGHRDFDAFSTSAGRDSFASRHTAVAWAVATPFAREYGMPWLYGLATVTNLARIGDRKHWLSDTVVSSLLGYGLGRMFHETAKSPRKGMPRLTIDGSGIGLAWELE